MKLQRNKTLSTIALILMLTLSAFVIGMPTANAHTPAWNIPTWCYVSLTNSVVGVNQQVTIVYWLNDVPPTAMGDYGDRWTFTVEVTKPDGSKDTLGPFTSDPVGSGWASYVPKQLGTYTIVAKFPGKVINTPTPPSVGYQTAAMATYLNDTYAASTSDPVTLTVQQAPIQPWSEAPLPTQFWTRPINTANRNWYVLAGNWLAGAAQNVGPTTRFSYGTGPESAHIMWATSMWAGGIMDARFGETGFETGHYEGTDFVPPIILNGKIYYNVYSLPREGWICLDLYTGQQLYFHNTTGPATQTFVQLGISGSSGSIAGESLAFGQLLDFECPNQHGGFPYLWSTTPPAPITNTWMMFDSETGNYICSIGNITQTESRPGNPSITTGGTGTAVYGKDGSLLRYNIVNLGNTSVPKYYLQVWNTTQAILYRPPYTYAPGAFAWYWLWRPILNYTFDGQNGFTLNATIPAVQGTIRAVREDQFVIGGTGGQNDEDAVVQGNLWALNLKPAADGTITPTLLWNITFTPPRASATAAKSTRQTYPVSGPTVDPEDGVFIFNEVTTRSRWGYSLATGQLLWGPTAPEPALNFYSMGTNIYQGMLLSTGFGGELIAYNITTGKVLWNYNATQVGFESPYGNYPINIAAIADGKLYLISGEHSISQPMWRGPDLRCINASNGAELWKILQFGADGGASLGGMYVVMSDGFVVGLNQYDGQIYCYGKGPSATTVTASPAIIATGSAVLIQGTVTDQSPGAKDTPAIADASMEQWMEYLYEQQQIPGNATGVPVTLTALDPNGNMQNIGTVTSDMTGLFSAMWTPPVPGKYTVTASFGGSKSYYGSYAETAFGVGAAPAAQVPASPSVTSAPAPTSAPSVPPSVTPTPAAPPSNPASSMTLYIAIAATVIIIVVAAAALALKRRR
jgi:hypothetical protein